MLVSRMAFCSVFRTTAMKTRTYLIAFIAIAISSCADPSGVTPPIVENPKPVEIVLTPEHLAEASGDDQFLSGGDGQEYDYALENTLGQPWSFPTVRSTLVLDTIRGRLLRLRLNMIPRAKNPQDTARYRIRRFILELDSTANLSLEHRERKLSHGEAAYYLREIGTGGRVFYRSTRISATNPDIPSELRDSVTCIIRLWRSSKRTIVLKLTALHYAQVEGPAPRKIVRLRLNALLEVPLAQ